MAIFPLTQQQAVVALARRFKQAAESSTDLRNESLRQFASIQDWDHIKSDF